MSNIRRYDSYVVYTLITAYGKPLAFSSTVLKRLNHAEAFVAPDSRDYTPAGSVLPRHERLSSSVGSPYLPMAPVDGWLQTRLDVVTRDI